MNFLRLLEQIRNPFFDSFFELITHLGSEAAFMAVTLFIFWCCDKKQGYYLLSVGFIGTVLNQALKLIFRIPRPWMLDNNFTIVESARNGATGYSFPSGHTQNAVGTYGGIARNAKNKIVFILSISIAFLVAFSRMYLGVHTPLDVGVSIILATILVFILKPLVDKLFSKPLYMYIFFGIMLSCNIAYLLFVNCYHFPSDIDIANYNSGLKNGYTMLGCIIGVIIGYFIDSNFVNFNTDAEFWGQIIKLSGGLLIVILLKSLLKNPLYTLFSGHFVADTVRYFLIVIFALAVWPLTFKFLADIGKKPGC